jgi:hypothetical protein
MSSQLSPLPQIPLIYQPEFISNSLQGLKFESKIHDKFSEYPVFSLFREKEIKNMYGSENSGIDHIIEYENKRIYIQDKREETSPNIRDINHFEVCSKNIELQVHSVGFLKLFVSKTETTINGDKTCCNNNIENIYESDEKKCIEKVFDRAIDFFGLRELISSYKIIKSSLNPLFHKQFDEIFKNVKSANKNSNNIAVQPPVLISIQEVKQEKKDIDEQVVNEMTKIKDDVKSLFCQMNPSGEEADNLKRMLDKDIREFNMNGFREYFHELCRKCLFNCGNPSLPKCILDKLDILKLKEELLSIRIKPKWKIDKYKNINHNDMFMLYSRIGCGQFYREYIGLFYYEFIGISWSECSCIGDFLCQHSSYNGQIEGTDKSLKDMKPKKLLTFIKDFDTNQKEKRKNTIEVDNSYKLSIKKIPEKHKKQQCMRMLKNGNQCRSKAVDGTNYCGKHSV